MESAYNMAAHRQPARKRVHKAMLAVVVGRSGQAEEQWLRRKFGTTTRELQNLVAWLQPGSVDRPGAAFPIASGASQGRTCTQRV